MRITLLLVLIESLLGAISAGGSEHPISPDGRFEAYTTAHNPDGTGERLFLRAAGRAEAGVLLRENDRWIRTSWSPDSGFLAVIDGSDGHVTDVFVYRILRSRATDAKAHYATFQSGGDVADSAQAPGLVAQLCYHTPNLWTYDVQWDVAGWDASRDTILLTRSSHAAKLARIKVTLNATQTRK